MTFGTPLFFWNLGKFGGTKKKDSSRGASGVAANGAAVGGFAKVCFFHGSKKTPWEGSGELSLVGELEGEFEAFGGVFQDGSAVVR